jgi:hypothetical protein
MTNAEFFASGHPVMRRLIAWGPVAFSVRLGIAAVVMLLLPARLAGVHSFPFAGEDRGFWFEANWSVMYAVVFPGVFGGLVYMINLMRDAIARLTCVPLRVIRKKGEDGPADFERYLASEMSRHARSFTWICFLLAAVLTTVHGGTLARFLILRDGAPPIVDWTTMFAASKVSYQANLLFDVVAYSFEAFVIFLGFFFVLKFWLFLYIFSGALRNADTPYEFQPLVHDPAQSLGLRPLGAFMNVYLVLVIVFEVYVFGRRLQLVGKGGAFSLSGYVTALVDGAARLKNALDPRMYQWETIDAGLWALLIFLTLPLIVAAYLPLWTLRRYVARRRDDEWANSARAHDQAKERGDEVEAEKLAKRMLLLEKTQLWPNGDATGWRLLVLSVAIGLAAWAPPLCAGIVAVTGMFELGKLIRTRVFAGGG